MKVLNLLSLGALLATAFAQGADIGAPADGSTVRRGSKIIVEIDRPDTLTGSTEIAIVIGFLFCGQSLTSQCPPPSEILGTILYNGNYTPEFHTGVMKPPHQNFTVKVPSSASLGKAQLGVAHFSLVGVSFRSTQSFA
ncbi:hypothetical protein MSAN_00215300 [Mycena sanguinolenta]|uniref:Phosphatidylglycerol/phosphatidylinositol transfer protein n=1 Tax=Mycena sanguinolenta TaxID=230812 RepID=A0A8H6ZLY2_9AGAR|nr:hypothetical protein MSAN_00215300 [Mycena sanguinolenta]